MIWQPTPFRPRFRGGHRQTLYAWARPRSFPNLPRPVSRYFDVAPDARVLAHCHWHDHRRDHPTLLLLHGLEGSSQAHYMAGIADKAWMAGWNVVRLNQRNCGQTEHLSRGLYHSGLTHDPGVEPASSGARVADPFARYPHAIASSYAPARSAYPHIGIADCDHHRCLRVV